MKTVNILLAPNSFKNSLTAGQACEAISDGLKASKFNCNPILFPVGDGGDGTGDLLVQRLGASSIQCKVHDPVGRIIDATYGLVRPAGPGTHATAIIELASASGLRLLSKDEYNPLYSSTYGTGEMILDALQKGARKIILCIGGSATVDAGLGILDAFGIRFFDENGNQVLPVPNAFDRIVDFDDSAVTKLLSGVEMIILCDVVNQLLGVKGAAAVFGPQKGASPADVIKLDQGLRRLREVILRKKKIDMDDLKSGGAAGGVSAGLHACCGARLVNGIEYFLDLTAFDEALKDVGMLVTGEGSIDVQTLEGKAPYGVARRAKAKGIPVIGIGGKVPLKPDPELEIYFDVLLGINNDAMDLGEALKNAGENLRRTAYALGNLLSVR